MLFRFINTPCFSGELHRNRSPWKNQYKTSRREKWRGGVGGALAWCMFGWTMLYETRMQAEERVPAFYSLDVSHGKWQ